MTSIEMAIEQEIEKREEAPFVAPDTKYFKSREEFDRALGKDFIKHANKVLERGEKFIVGLSHGQSPAGGYEYIFKNYAALVKPENIIYTFVNSPLSTQVNLTGVTDATAFVRKLYKAGYIKRNQILGSSISRQSLETYIEEFNKTITGYLQKENKTGLDYVFLACSPEGRVAAIERNSKSFDSSEISVLVNYRKEKAMTATPYFLKLSARIAFLATKADKRRPLAWLYSVHGKPNESPSFLRFIDKVEKRMSVFIDDEALTWPQIEVVRETPYGNSIIRIDTATPYKPNAKEKLPVMVMVHGFLGLNSFDGLLASISTQKCIAAAMHYGTIPHDLPPAEYSHHIAKNIDAVVDFFGSKGHPVYLFDHSMGNIYFLMIDRELKEYPAIKKYLRGRIGANPFFGIEAKHALLGFLDTVIMPSMSPKQSLTVRTMLLALRSVIPFDSKKGVRKRGINLTDWLISKDSEMREKIWAASKVRIIELMSEMDSLPHLNRIPIEQALNRLPAKVFAIQTHSALEQSIAFDNQKGLINFPKYNIPVLILKSEHDGVAKFVPEIYQGRNIQVVDVTNAQEHDLFREHLFFMVYPEQATQIIENFIAKTEAEKRAEEN
ncbi:MAG: 6-phosphogluconolactonase [Chitinophagales bacterium]|nr:6-phosphogluconolactonase [Chitinophagales bacterium]